MTRRTLLAAALAGLARGAPASKGAQLAAINDEIGATLPDTIAFAKQYGLEWIEMRSAQVRGKLLYCENQPEEALREMRRQLSDAGMRVSVLDTSVLKFVMPGTVAVQKEDFYIRYFAGLGLNDDTLFRDRVDMLKRTIDSAHALGTNDLRIFSFWRVADPAAIATRVADILSELADVAKKQDARLLLENETDTNVATSAESEAMLKLVPSLYLNWDPQNAIALEPAPFPDGYRKLPIRRIANVHVKAEGLFGPKHPIDWAPIMSAMIKDGYTGRFSLETHRGQGPKNIEASHACMEKMVGLIKLAKV